MLTDGIGNGINFFSSLGLNYDEFCLYICKWKTAVAFRCKWLYISYVVLLAVAFGMVCTDCDSFFGSQAIKK